MINFWPNWTPYGWIILAKWQPCHSKFCTPHPKQISGRLRFFQHQSLFWYGTWNDFKVLESIQLPLKFEWCLILVFFNKDTCKYTIRELPPNSLFFHFQENYLPLAILWSNFHLEVSAIVLSATNYLKIEKKKKIWPHWLFKMLKL